MDGVIQLGGGVVVEGGNLHIAAVVRQQLIFHTGNGVPAAGQGDLLLLAGGVQVGHRHGGAGLAPQAAGHVVAGQSLDVRAVNGGDVAALFQPGLGGGGIFVHPDDAGRAGGVLHHIHADAHQLAVGNVLQLRIGVGRVVNGGPVTGAQHIAGGNGVVQGVVVDLVIGVVAHILVDLRQLGVHILLFLNAADGVVEVLACQHHRHREGHGHGDDGNGDGEADGNFLIHGVTPSGRPFFFAAFRPLVRFPARAGHGNVRPAPSRQGRAHRETVVQNRYAS